MNPPTPSQLKPTFRPEPRPSPERNRRPAPARASTHSLHAEIETLRAILLRVLHASGETVTDLDQWIGLLQALASASTRLAGLLASRRSLDSKDGLPVLGRALAELIREWKHDGS